MELVRSRCVQRCARAMATRTERKTVATCKQLQKAHRITRAGHAGAEVVVVIGVVARVQACVQQWSTERRHTRQHAPCWTARKIGSADLVNKRSVGQRWARGWHGLRSGSCNRRQHHQSCYSKRHHHGLFKLSSDGFYHVRSFSDLCGRG